MKLDVSILTSVAATSALLSPAAAASILAAKVGNPYPEYAGDVQPKGSVTVSFPGSGLLTFAYELQGLEANCTYDPNVPNSCGVHIHAGTTCNNATLVGGHYYDENTVQEDPWIPPLAVYTSDSSGNAEGSFDLTTGYGTYEDNLGRAVVVHASDGSRVTCDILEAKPDDSDADSSSASDGDSSSAPLTKRGAFFLHVGFIVAAAVVPLFVA